MPALELLAEIAYWKAESDKLRAELLEAQLVARELALRWVEEHGYDNHRDECEPLIDKALSYPAAGTAAKEE